MANQASSTIKVPRIAIEFCTQCKWNLRAAYYAQELLQTFNTSIGEIALIPATGGVFTVTLTHHVTGDAETTGAASNLGEGPVNTVIWDRKTDGGFPETKELKNRVRNIVEPARDLGHIDRSLKKTAALETGADTKASIEDQPGQPPAAVDTESSSAAADCKDCK